jgi:hypothetical protein
MCTHNNVKGQKVFREREEREGEHLLSILYRGFDYQFAPIPSSSQMTNGTKYVWSISHTAKETQPSCN